MWKVSLRLALSGFAAASVACGGPSKSVEVAPANVAPAPPPRDDGKSSQGGGGGVEHAAALEQLKVGAPGLALDKQRSIRMPLPDSAHWTGVKFWGVPSLAGYRYGKGHHAIAGAFVTHVADNREPGACGRSFEEWASKYVEMFEVRIEHRPAYSIVWNGQIVSIASLDARSAMLADQDDYRAAYAAYPVWNNACLIAGIAVPARGEVARATAVRDRFVKDILPLLEVISKEEPKERY